MDMLNLLPTKTLIYSRANMTIKTVKVTSNLTESNRLKNQVAQRTSDTPVPGALNFGYNGCMGAVERVIKSY